MSGGNSSKGKAHSSKRQEGWEEAGGEFYQESYPGGSEQETLEQLQHTDAAKLATLLPSKQLRAATVKRVRSQTDRRQSTCARTAQSHDVHLSMLPDLSENLSNEERTWEEIMTIKAMPVPMAQKLELKAQLQNATKLRLQGLEQLQWKQRKAYHRMKTRCSEIVNKMELWRSSMNVIEGIFGTGVVTFFLLLRWLLFLNLTISVIIVLFLVLPQTLLERRDECEGNTTECCYEKYMSKGVDTLEILDVVQGTGKIERTMLYYGVYSNKVFEYTVNIFEGLNVYYNMPLAYITVAISWFVLSLGAIVKSATKGFQEHLVQNEGQFYKYCNMVFGGWDFCIHNGVSARIKHKALYNEIRSYLEEEKWNEEKKQRSREEQFYLILRRLFVNIVVLAILFCAGYLIYLTFNYSAVRLDATQTNMTMYGNITRHARIDEEWYSWSSLQMLLLEFSPYLCITILNMIVPEIFRYLLTLENYTPPFEIKISLYRTVFLRLSALAVLLSQIYIRVNDPGIRVCASETSESPLECWETYVGQQFYKLILSDFLIQILITFFVNYPRSQIARHTNSKLLKILGEQEFNLQKHVLDAVYAQTIIWLGALFCPFLPIIGSVFCFLIFYVKKFACIVNSTPSQTLYRASKSKSMFMFVLFISFVCSLLIVGYAIMEIRPSLNCGPFRGLTAFWDIVVNTYNMFPEFLRSFVYFLGTAAFAVPAYAIVTLLLYYFWAVASANRRMVTVLKSQLVLEGHDKQFLLNRLSAIIRRNQKKSERRYRASFADSDSIQQSSN